MKNTTAVQLKKIAAVMAMLLLTLSFGPKAQSAVPQVMSYQGLLKNNSGNLLSGTYSMQFKIYSASTGGSALWTETQSSVSVSSGRFSVQLGSVTALNLDFNQDYWLSIKVGSDAEMTPRVRLTSVGYAYRAQEVVNGFTQAQHDALSHKNIEGVKDNAALIAKTNFKLDAYTLASANSMGDMVVDSFNDSTGISAASSSNYTYRGASNYDVVLASAGGAVIQQQTSVENDFIEVLSNYANSYNGFGQQFKHTANATIDKVSFKWCKWGSPTGNVKIRIYTSSSGMPGSLLGETANISVSGIASVYPNTEEITANLTSPVALTANTTYLAVIENVSGTGNGDNHIKIRRASGGNPYANGAPVIKSNSNVWANYGDSVDAYFKIYEQAQSSGTATVVSNAYTLSASPSEALLMVDQTLGTGTITYSLSRNNGTNWTTCNPETVCSLASQPSGTQLKWKAAITGNAELNAIAVSV